MTTVSLDPLDLAALLCSRVCHDVISPVGAIVNGLEMLEEEKDAEMRQMSLDLVRKSAQTASARLQFCRLAFGAAGSAGAAIDTGDAETVARGLLQTDKVKLLWNMPRVLMPKNRVKVILNLCLIASAAIPRGGTIDVSTAGEGGGASFHVKAAGTSARIAHGVAQLLEGQPEGGSVDAHGIQAYYTGLVARAAGLSLHLTVTSDMALVDAMPIAVEAAAVA